MQEENWASGDISSIKMEPRLDESFRRINDDLEQKLKSYDLSI
jgi:hypothetical protein